MHEQKNTLTFLECLHKCDSTLFTLFFSFICCIDKVFILNVFTCRYMTLSLWIFTFRNCFFYNFLNKNKHSLCDWWSVKWPISLIVLVSQIIININNICWFFLFVSSSQQCRIYEYNLNGCVHMIITLKASNWECRRIKFNDL